MQLRIFYDHGQTFKTVRFEDSITVQEAIRRFAERTPLYTTADPTLYGFYLPDSYPYLSSYPSASSSSTTIPHALPTTSTNPSPPTPSPPLSSPPQSGTSASLQAGSDDMDGVGWLENDRLLSSYHIKDFLLFKKKSGSLPRKIASNFTLAKIHLPTSDKTLKYDTKMTVKEAIHYLKSRNPGVDMTNYGLFLLYAPHDVEGFFLHEDRTIASYDLDYQSELHFIPQDKKVYPAEVSILFPKQQVRRKAKVDPDTTLLHLTESTFADLAALHLMPTYPSPTQNHSLSDKIGFFLPPYDDGVGRFVDGSASVLHALAGNEPFVVYQPLKEKDESLIRCGDKEVEVHVVAPIHNTHSFQRKTIWASKNGVSLKVRVDEEATMFELKDAVKKLLVGQKVQWALALSDWGVYLPHQTEGETLLEDDTPVISTPTSPVGTQFVIKPKKGPESFSGTAQDLQVVVHQYSTRAQNKFTLPVDKATTISVLKDQIFEVMGTRLTKEQAHDYVLSRPCIVDDGEYYDDDVRDLTSYKLDMGVPLEYKPRPQYPDSSEPLVILSIALNPDANARLPVFSRGTDIFLRIPVHSRALKFSHVLKQLLDMIQSMENPKLAQTIQEFSDYSLYWKERNIWLNSSRTVLSYGIPIQHTLQLQVKPVGVHIRLWNYLIPQTLGYFKFSPTTLVTDIDKKDLFLLIRTDPQVAHEKMSRNRTVSIHTTVMHSPKVLKTPTEAKTDKYLQMDFDLDPDLYGFWCVPEGRVGYFTETPKQPYWLDPLKTLQKNDIVEGSVIELKPTPQSLNVIYPDPMGGRASNQITFEMDKPIAGYLPIPLEKNDRIIWQKEPHNPSGILLDPSQSLSAQGIRPYYGASIILNRNTQKKAKHEDNSIDGQINRDLWEELRSSESEGLVLNSEGLVQAGTVNRLIEHLTSSKIHDLTFMKTFLLTYQAFITPKIFFAKLVSRYHVPAPPDTTDIGNFVENLQRPIQLRVCNVLKKTIDLSFREFDTALLQEMNVFLETVLIPSGNVSLAQKIQNSIMKHLQATSKPKVNLNFGQSPPPTSKIMTPTSTQSVLDFDPLEIARQLTILEYETYAAIEPAELLNQAWCKQSLMHRSPNVLKMIARFNGVSSWVTGALIEPEELKNRVKVFKKVIAIGKALLELNSLNMLMAIIAGWNNSGVLRLKYTIKEIPKKTQEDMAQLESLMNSEGSYKKYRAYLHNANPPQIPYIGIYLSDLTFIEEGNDDTLKGLVNFEKLRLICTVILELQQYQQQPYNLTRLPELSDLMQKELSAAAAVDEAVRYQKSLQREPRNAKRDDVR